MDTLLKKKPGNPNFSKKDNSNANSTQIDINKQYVFQLLKTHEKQKPRDGQTGELVGSPYQPWFGVVNSGVAWDKNYTPKGSTTQSGGARRWRYLYNYPTIWVDEQIDPEPTKEDLAAPENDLIFRQGVLRVFGHETMKLKAMQLNNAFEGCERPLKNVPKEYQLLDQEKIDKEVLLSLDEAFEAEKAAREASLDDMYAVGYTLGIDLNKSDDFIRKEFIHKARTNPKHFNREFIAPKNKVKYIFLEGLNNNIISDTMIPGTVHLVDANIKVWDMRTHDAAEELSIAVLAGDKEARTLHDKLKVMLENI